MDVPDVMSWLIDAVDSSEKAERQAEFNFLQNDARLFIVAGRYVRLIAAKLKSPCEINAYEISLL
jgi:hypothetical protein